LGAEGKLKTPEELDGPPGFFGETAGVIQNSAI
jgi:hypothetical protein